MLFFSSFIHFSAIRLSKTKKNQIRCYIMHVAKRKMLDSCRSEQTQEASMCLRFKKTGCCVRKKSMPALNSSDYLFFVVVGFFFYFLYIYSCAVVAHFISIFTHFLTIFWRFAHHHPLCTVLLLIFKTKWLMAGISHTDDEK